MDQYEIIWPEDFDDLDNFVWWEIEQKGCLSGVKIRVGAGIIEPQFHDKVRLLQEVEAELEYYRYFAEPAVIVLERVTKPAIEEVVERMASTGALKQLVRTG